MPRLVKRNWDQDCWCDLLTGKGFEITQPAFANKIDKNMYGIQSPLFGSDWSDEDAFTERYTCKCGELRGNIFNGETCPVCKTEVIFRDVDLSITGWIKLNNHRIIQPAFYIKLASIIGDKQFLEIIEFGKKVKRDGDLELTVDSKNPFKGIGLIEFEKRFFEIMEYYRVKKKNKWEAIEEVLNESEKVFTSCIPVHSSVLRPVSFKGDGFFHTKIDKKYNPIFSLSRLLNDKQLYEKRRKGWNKDKRERMDIPTILASVQKKLMEIWDLVFDQIDHKEGHIKSEIIGGMLNFSCRSVIIPDPSLHADEVSLNYHAMLELYKYEIIAHIVKISNVTENEANEQWIKARIKFNSKVYEIMNYIIKKCDPRVIINRNPTINYGSLLCMKVVRVKAEFQEDYTMSIPIQILQCANADFDGDILNIISLKSKEWIKAFDDAFNPRKNMFIDRNDGLFSSQFNLYRDQLIGLYEFNNID